ncbi:MAG: geranylgeranyl reductase family protein [Acidimicrobiales bacterium]
MRNSDLRVDVAVVGSGPGGSVAAGQLARAGVKVALVDKARFPRDKACGDLIGPRGIELLDRIGPGLDHFLPLGDMAVVGPRGGTVVLPAVAGRDFGGAAWALPRRQLDATLHKSAADSGAEIVNDRVVGVEIVCATTGRGAGGGVGTAGSAPGTDAVVHLDSGGSLFARTVIGADGATSVVAASAGMVRADRVLWGFAVRTYLHAEVELPSIVLFDRQPGIAFPGYGWIFPGPDGMANVGVGAATGSDRRAGSIAARQLDSFLGLLTTLDLIDGTDLGGRRLGGWLKMGMVGTTPVAGPVLLIGDAAGLVNPLQGEGIAQAMMSGEAAASAVLTSGGPDAGRLYGRWLARHQSAYQGSTAVVQNLLLRRPKATSKLARALTWPPVGKRLAPAWALYWNDLVVGGPPGAARQAAWLVNGAIRAGTAGSGDRRSLARRLVEPPNDPTTSPTRR